MPIRMDKDRPSSKNQGGSGGGRRRGPGMPVLLGAMYLALKNPRLLIPIIIILGFLYFIGGNFGGAGSDLSTLPWEYESSTNAFTFGAELNEEIYDQAEVFEPLASGYGGGLPSRAMLESFAPPVLHQGRQGSCSGWASAYSARTISYASSNGLDPVDIAFSPSFLYNQIALPGCQGAYLKDAMESMYRVGSLPFDDFAYDERTCSIEPEPYDKNKAGQYRIKGYQRLSEGANNYSPDLSGIKQHLAQGTPVIIGIMVGKSFQAPMRGRKLWEPTRSEYNGYGLGGHAMCVVGYDDNYAGGAFRIMNSWGSEWGENGFCWVRYRDFAHFTKEAYGLYPEGPQKRYDKNQMKVKFGLVDNATNVLIPLEQRDEIVFGTEKALRPGDRFKMAVTNDIECYTYIFGMESDGSSYVLFPYTEKHSPYCGITGTRLFPRDYSMTPDDIGNRDYIAIVISKDRLDANAVNQAINQSSNAKYWERVVDALRDDFVPACDFDIREGGAVFLDCNTEDTRRTIATIIEIDKT